MPATFPLACKPGLVRDIVPLGNGASSGSMEQRIIMAGKSRQIVEITDELKELAEGDDETTLGEVVDAFGNRGQGPLLILPSMLVLTPLGGIPLLPTIMAVVVVLFAGQMLIGKEGVSLPRFLRERGVSGDKVASVCQKIRPLAKWLDGWFHGRLRKLVTPVFVRVAAAFCILLAVLVPPLEVVPFASAAPMAAILLFGLAITVQDGLLMAVAFVVAVAALLVGVSSVL